MSRQLLFAAAIALPTPAGGQEPDVEIRVSGMGSKEAPCVAQIGDRRVRLKDFAELIRQRPIAEVRVSFVPDTAYRCVGGFIFEAQRANVTRIGFISEPSAQ